jgi:arylsulfatase A-like enzyme
MAAAKKPAKKAAAKVASKAVSKTASQAAAAPKQLQALNRYVLPIPERVAQHDTPMDANEAAKPKPKEFLRPPPGAPNVLIVLIDDMGFGASSAFGGPCAMPIAERVAKNGLKFTRFHTTALCSPSRAALLTGRNHHTVNMGGITEVATAMPGNTGIRPDTCATLAHILKYNGYSTGAFGKMHQTPTWESSVSGPFDRWPIGDGFEKFYGFLGGDTNQYAPPLIDGVTQIEPPKTAEEGYHLTEDLVDQVINWTGSLQAMTPDKPWFAYLSFGATHAPHHVPKAWIDRYKGKFDHGYNQQREITFAKQKKLGVIPKDAELTKATEWLPEWDELTDDDRKVSCRLAETYAAFASHTDHHVGRLLDTLDKRGVLDDTLVIYILGDNGSSAEAGPYGTFNEMAFQNGVLMKTADILPRIDEIGGPTAFNHMPSGWAHAFNTPYQWSKIVASHWGGTRVGMTMSWGKRIKKKGEVRHQFHHLIDIAPTVLELAGIPEPDFVNGIQQKPMEGTSIAYLFDKADAEDRHKTQYFEIGCNRGIYHEGWSAVTMHRLPWPDPREKPRTIQEDPWELYGPDDWTQARNIADKNPEMLRKLQDRFLIEAAKYNVLPLDPRQRERFDARVAGRPDLLAGRTSMTFLPGMTRLNENTVPNVKNTSFTVTAKVELGAEPAQGAIIAQGGAFGGWCVYFKDGVLAYAHNFVGLETYTVRATKAVRKGAHEIVVQFDYDGGGSGKGGKVTLLADGKKIGSGRIEKTVPGVFSFDDFLDIGQDKGEPVVDDYGDGGGTFNGTIESVTVDVSPDAEHDHDLLMRAKQAKQ